MSILSKLIVKIGADTKELDKSMAKTQGNLKAFGKGMSNVGMGMTKYITAPALAGASALVIMTNRYADAADAIDKMSIRTGIARGTLQQLQYATDQAGVSFESIQTSVGAFTNQLKTADSESSAMREAFKDLGIEMENMEGNIRPINDLYMESLRALAGMEDKTKRNILASRLFGRQFMELIPLLDGGVDELDRLMNKAEELNLVMSDEGIASLVAYEDAMSELKMQFGAVWREIATKFAPIMTQTIIPMIQNQVIPAIQGLVNKVAAAVKWFSELSPATQGMIIKMAAFVVAAGPVLALLGNLVVVLSGAGGLIEAVKGMAAANTIMGGSFAALAASGGPIMAAVAAFALLYNVINSVIKSQDQWLINQKTPATKNQFNVALDNAGRDPGTAPKVYNAPTTSTTKTGSGGTAMMAEGGTVSRSGSSWVGERGPELLNLPVGAKVTPLDKTGTMINITVTGNTISRDYDVDRMMDQMVKKLRLAGVRV